MIKIRPEIPADIEAIRSVNLDAFPEADEANLVDALRTHALGHISLVAIHETEVVGHIMFSPAGLKGQALKFSMAGLAPMAVLGTHQNLGIGSQLVEAGLEACKEKGYAAVAVLGHPEFYPRFGFVPSVQFGIKSEYEVPEEVFMIQELEKDVLSEVEGILVYHECFAAI